jgi:hypothetical protein
LTFARVALERRRGGGYAEACRAPSRHRPAAPSAATDLMAARARIFAGEIFEDHTIGQRLDPHRI